MFIRYHHQYRQLALKELDKRLSGVDQSGTWPSLEEPGGENLVDEDASIDSVTVDELHSQKVQDNTTNIV